MNAADMKALREHYGILVRDMAVSARIAFVNYQAIESGRMTPTRQQLNRIEKVFERHEALVQQRLARWNDVVGEKGGAL